MRKKTLKYISVLLTILIFSACSSDKNGSLTLRGTDGTYAETEAKKENGFYPEETERAVEFPETDASFTGFEGLGGIGDAPKLGNDPQNLTADLFYCGIVCGDDDCVYYTAIGYDNFLHRKRNGADEVFIEKTVWGINIVDGEMYCIMNTEIPVQTLTPLCGGDIYKVDLETGEMTLVLATRAVSLAAPGEKLLFIYDNGSEYDVLTNRVYECDRGGKNIIPRDAAILGFVGEYTLCFDKFGQNSCLESASGERIRYTADNRVYNFVSDGDFFYFSPSGSTLCRVNAVSGEITSANPADKFKNVTLKFSESESSSIGVDPYIGGYRIVDGAVYTVFGGLAFRMNSDGTAEVFITPNYYRNGWFYEGLFGDGEALYSVAYSLERRSYKLVRLEFTDEEAFPGIKTVKETDLL